MKVCDHSIVKANPTSSLKDGPGAVVKTTVGEMQGAQLLWLQQEHLACLDSTVDGLYNLMTGFSVTVIVASSFDWSLVIQSTWRIPILGSGGNSANQELNQLT